MQEPAVAAQSPPNTQGISSGDLGSRPRPLPSGLLVEGIGAIAVGADPVQRASSATVEVLLPPHRRSATGAPEVSPQVEALRRAALHRRLLATGDAFAILFASLLTVGALRSTPTPILALLPLLVIPLAKLAGLYDRDDLVIRKSTLSELPKLLEVVAGVTFVAYVFRRAFMPGAGSRELLLSSFYCSGALFIAAFRVLARRAACRLSPTERCLIVGDVLECGSLARVLASQRGVEVVGTVRIEAAVESLGSLGSVVNEYRAHRLVIAQTSRVSPEQTLELIRHANVTGAKVSIQPTLMAAVGGAVVFDELGGQTLLGVPRFGLPRSSRILKRTFDVAGSAMALFLLAPLLAVIAVIIKLDSPGPPLFRQIRVGRDGRRFVMFKFRSMVCDADAMRCGLAPLNQAGEGLFKIRDDPRVTNIGRWLRRARLDELPQLLNVFRGEMSLVGPRPLIVEEDERVAGIDRHRLHLTPGMTGRWQVLGTSELTLDEMSKLDFLYIANWSMWEDIRILLGTLGLISKREGV